MLTRQKELSNNSSFRDFLKNPLTLFVVKALGLFLAWILLYEFWLHPIGKFDLFVIDKLIVQAGWVLETFGYQLINDGVYDSEYRTIGLDGTHGVWIGDPCNGISVFGLFVGFILAYPGSWLKKFWFIPFGVLSIHMLNVIRVAALCVVLKDSPASLEFNHTYLFTTIIYTYVFAMWYLWANKLSE